MINTGYTKPLIDNKSIIQNKPQDSSKVIANAIVYRVSSPVWWGVFWKISWEMDNVHPTNKFLKDKVFRLR